MESKRSNFYMWLTKQADRDDPIGDLATDIIEDKRFPEGLASYSQIMGHIIFQSHDTAHAQEALKEAWEEFNLIQNWK